MSFKILKKYSYLDNASSTQKPKEVINAITDFYENSYSNTHRGVYYLSEKATDLFEKSREKVAKLINCNTNEVVFTSGATQALNYLAQAYKNKTVLVTEIEHHSNIVNWQKHAKQVNYVPYNKDLGMLDHIPFHYNNEDIVSFTMMSNVSGEILNVKKIISELKEKNPNVIIILDACQSMSHMKIDVKELNCDFLAFSGHKMYGPMGVGVLFGKQKHLEELDPFIYGGNMVLDVGKEKTTFKQPPHKHEAGTMNGAGVIGLGAAIDFLLNNFEEKVKKEKELQDYLVKNLRKEGALIVGHTSDNFGPVVSFILDIHPHDFATICDRDNVCIRAGHHCAQLFMEKLNVVSTCRASLSFYNTKKDVDKLINCIKKARGILNG